MRRKWPVVTAAIPLAFGWAMVAAHPAAASIRHGGPGHGAQVRPGGLVGQLSQPGGPLSEPGGWMSEPGDAFPGAPTGIVTPQASSSQSGGQNASVSSNWAGYAATGAAGSFTSVSASWTQPAASCAAGSQYAAFWVGLDGYTSKTVEQIGTEADCTGPNPQYYAWYEVYPGAGVNFANPVSPGDKFTGTVTAQGNDKFRLVLTDTTRGWTQTISATKAGADLSSAEAIAEAPSGPSANSSPLPLTNFGSVGFTGVTANGKSLDTLDPVQISMPNTSVAGMASDGSFSVTYAGTGGTDFAPWFGI
jgi:hypothetical protein